MCAGTVITCFRFFAVSLCSPVSAPVQSCECTMHVRQHRSLHIYTPYEGMLYEARVCASQVAGPCLASLEMVSIVC
jgi:hypothetical protein